MIYINQRKSSKGFALLYTILFIFLIVITVLMIWAAGMADIRLQRRSGSSTEAYQLAQNAIEEGWLKYHREIDDDYPMPEVFYPDDDPSGSCEQVHRVYLDGNPPGTDDVLLSELVPLDRSLAGIYDYRICIAADGVGTIEGIGYYSGSKITLIGDITHNDVGFCDGGVGANEDNCELVGGGTWKLNHNDDTLNIYQVGPSEN